MAYTFDVVIILERDDHEELSLVRRTHNLYYPVVLQLVEAWTKLYRQNGWRVKSFHLQNFDFEAKEITYEHS